MAESKQDNQTPNSAPEMEQAEGSRDTVKGNAQRGAGITNRPLEAEQEEQENLPPRGTNKEKSHA
jgi:hypothetical protein